jgi:hypothetical protein
MSMESTRYSRAKICLITISRSHRSFLDFEVAPGRPKKKDRASIRVSRATLFEKRVFYIICLLVLRQYVTYRRISYVKTRFVPFNLLIIRSLQHFRYGSDLQVTQLDCSEPSQFLLSIFIGRVPFRGMPWHKHVMSQPLCVAVHPCYKLLHVLLLLAETT